MKPYPVKYRRISRPDPWESRCVNPCCGYRGEMDREKTCPVCGKRSVGRAGGTRCGCGAAMEDGDPVCPRCGSKQRTVAELRGLDPENLTAFTHLLHRAQPSVSLAECRETCRRITAENPYRLSFAGHPEKIRPFIRDWNALRGTAAACLDRETSRRPVVMVRTYNRRREAEHLRLLLEAFRKSDFPSPSQEAAAAVLHRLNGAEQPFRLCFTSGFDGIGAWVAAWKSLGGTAVRSPEHR